MIKSSVMIQKYMHDNKYVTCMFRLVPVCPYLGFPVSFSRLVPIQLI